jgi:histidine triad (HIT) family protein
MSDCLFCKIICKEIKGKIEYEDEEFLVIHDINPQAPTHLLIMPKKHIESISAMQDSDSGLMGQLIHRAKQIAAAKGWEHYRLVFNNGSEAGQSVFHIHLHLLSGRRMHWPPG